MKRGDDSLVDGLSGQRLRNCVQQVANRAARTHNKENNTWCLIIKQSMSVNSLFIEFLTLFLTDSTLKTQIIKITCWIQTSEVNEMLSTPLALSRLLIVYR